MSTYLRLVLSFMRAWASAANRGRTTLITDNTLVGWGFLLGFVTVLVDNTSVGPR